MISLVNENITLPPVPDPDRDKSFPTQKQLMEGIRGHNLKCRELSLKSLVSEYEKTNLDSNDIFMSNEMFKFDKFKGYMANDEYKCEIKNKF